MTRNNKKPEEPAGTESVEITAKEESKVLDGSPVVVDGGDETPLLLTETEEEKPASDTPGPGGEDGNGVQEGSEKGAGPPEETSTEDLPTSEEKTADSKQSAESGNSLDGDPPPADKTGGDAPPPVIREELPDTQAEGVPPVVADVAGAASKETSDPPQAKKRAPAKKKTPAKPKTSVSASVEGDTPVLAKTPSGRASAAPAPTRESSVLTIESRADVETPESREEMVWHEMQQGMRTRRIFTGTLGGIERMENGNIIAVVYYKELRVVIPISEMMIQLSTEPNHYGDPAERESKLLNNMLGCEIDFLVKGLDNRTHSVVASRREAMLRKRGIFYFTPDSTGATKVRVGRIVQARVVAVATKVVRVEIFGVECSLLARDLSWEWIGDAHERYTVGDEILVRVKEINIKSLTDINVLADVRSVTENTVRENLRKCKVQGKYAGSVTDVHKGMVYVRLATGVNAIAHSCYDNRMPAKQDAVSFTVTHIDNDRGVAMGIITRILRQKI